MGIRFSLAQDCSVFRSTDELIRRARKLVTLTSEAKSADTCLLMQCDKHLTIVGCTLRNEDSSTTEGDRTISNNVDPVIITKINVSWQLEFHTFSCHRANDWYCLKLHSIISEKATRKSNWNAAGIRHIEWRDPCGSLVLTPRFRRCDLKGSTWFRKCMRKANLCNINRHEQVILVSCSSCPTVSVVVSFNLVIYHISVDGPLEELAPTARTFCV